jgi:hypothetical protein
MGHPQVEYTSSQSLEAIMPTADPFLLGYTIIIYIRFVFGGYKLYYIIKFLLC